MNLFKKIAVLCVAVVILVANANVVPVEASTYVGQVKNDEGGFLLWGWTTYTYKLYYEGSVDMAITSPSKLLTSSTKHTYGNTPKTIYGEQSQAYSYSTTLSFNSAIGAKVGLSDLVELSADKGYGVETGFSYTKAFLKGVSFTPSRYDRTGYYVIAGGATCKKMFWQKYLGSDKLNSQKGYFYMPYGARVIYTMYSSDNSNWKFY